MKPTTLLIRSAALCAALLLLSLPAAAQGFKWWQADSFKKELGLTQEQTRLLEEIFQKALPKLKTQKSTLDQAEARFAQLLERGEDAAIMEQVRIVEAARSELNVSRTMMLLKMKKVLTTDQWAKFTALQQAADRAPRDRTRPDDRGK